MGECRICRASSPFISKELAVCLACIRERPADALKVAAKAHMKSRAAFGLPERRPEDPDGIPCNLCVNECHIPDDGTGYCGLRRNL
jgi:pyruvate formate lyase activating enzyme